ncbi:MAG: GtrA family protein [Candidatus Dojkabacteria bacterium]|nr:GtrA family protein [Candidatus Dojkabacteria bacterium]MDQ7020234.1 GtrA family protein [Candidatus Dojkabacteria bacterium]
MINLAFKYAFFAIIATIFNISSQELIVRLGDSLQLQNLHIFSVNLDIKFFSSLLFGTLIGLLVKYILDKKYIFYYSTKGRKDDAEKFALYMIMGVITTIIFWGTESIFHILFDNEYSKYLGAILGLSIGYLIKYRLDSKYVFKKNTKESIQK